MKRFLLVPFVLLMLGCGLITQTIAPTETIQAPPTITPSNTPFPTPTVEITDTPIPSATVAATATSTSIVSGFGLLTKLQSINLQQFLDPIGSPVQTWHDISIMPQATAGEDFNNGVYSYKATATLNQAVAFYGRFGQPMATGYGGSGSKATHDATIMNSNLIIEIVSYDNDTSHVIVVIVTQ